MGFIMSRHNALHMGCIMMPIGLLNALHMGCIMMPYGLHNDAYWVAKCIAINCHLDLHMGCIMHCIWVA
jgi:hypothetical protein